MKKEKSIVKLAAEIKDNVNENIRKNRIISKLKTVLRLEKKVADIEFAAIGKYYYENMRDPENKECEAHCLEIDEALSRIASAEEHLNSLESEE
ncbi:MAG: hypothetical protein Q4C42_02800 [Clostridia bacterium]|nr:hypothetical protein [Clostridia bacterium]